MKEDKTIQYAKPEIVRFEWIEALGECSNGSGDGTKCYNGNGPGSNCGQGNTASPCEGGNFVS